MDWINLLLTAIIALIAVPITTLISLWLKWLWEHPKIKGYFAFEDKSVVGSKYPNMNNIRVNEKKSARRYKMSKLIFAGEQELRISSKFMAYRVNYKNMSIFI